MEGFEKVLLVGGGAFLAYKFGLLNSFLGTASTSAAPATPAPSSTNTPPATPTNPPPPSVPTWQLVVNRAVAAGQPTPGGFLNLTADQWDSYYNLVSGVAAPDPEQWVGHGLQDRNQLLQVSQWWALMQQAVPGLQGFAPDTNRWWIPESPRSWVPRNARDPFTGRFDVRA